MVYWTSYQGHEGELVGSRKKFDNTIYSFDIETSSYLILDGKQVNGCDYLNLSSDEQKRAIKCTTMYIWMFSINNTVYYGRTWDEFKIFIGLLDKYVPYRKIVFVHNLAFEFQYLKGVFNFNEVTARKSRQVMTALMKEYDIMFQCSYLMSNCKLAKLPKLFNLPVKKMEGDLDYDKIRHSDTPLTKLEFGYCENDCLVLYHYIKHELETYETVKNIPKTSTGKVRRELKELVSEDYSYKNKVKKAINTDPHVYNLLQECFVGGYTHACWIYADTVLKNVDSYDETSAYPYVMVAYKFPSSEFKKCNVKSHKDMSKNFAYILKVKFMNIKSKYYNNFMSASKCRNIRGAKYDNGRIIEAKELEITLTDIDFYLYLDCYTGQYEILEIYYANYNYLPKQFINFILDKYVLKTELKGLEGHELEYQKQKNLYNALYGMSVTNTIRDKVIYDDVTKLWHEEELTNDEICECLYDEKKKAFLSFSYGVWVTAWARNNLIRRVFDLDDYVVYCDTDSIKLVQCYDKNVFLDYNKSVENRIKYVADLLDIDFSRYSPSDKNGKPHLLGVFESETKEGMEHTYDEFITQGAKKYAVKQKDEIEITVSGVPKQGSKALKDLNDFRDDFVFEHKDTNKNLIMYVDDMQEFELTDYKGHKRVVNDISGCCVLPTTYVLGKALEYSNLITDNSSSRAKYKE